MVAQDGGGDDPGGQGQRSQGHSDRRVARIDLNLHYPDLAAREGLDVQCPWDTRQLVHLVGHRRLGLDDVIDAGETSRKGPDVLDVVLVAHPGDGLSHAHPLGGHAGDHVDFVGIGNSDQEVGPTHAHPFEDSPAGPVALHGQHVQFLGRPFEGLQVALDDGHLVTLLAEDGRDVEAHLSGANDDRVHGIQHSSDEVSMGSTWARQPASHPQEGP